MLVSVSEFFRIYFKLSRRNLKLSSPSNQSQSIKRVPSVCNYCQANPRAGVDGNMYYCESPKREGRKGITNKNILSARVTSLLQEWHTLCCPNYVFSARSAYFLQELNTFRKKFDAVLSASMAHFLKDLHLFCKRGMLFARIASCLKKCYAVYSARMAHSLQELHLLSKNYVFSTRSAMRSFL